jgi:RNA-directed DNA polymerase
MRREFHVRFCEGAGGQFPRATRLVVMHDSPEAIHKCQAIATQWLQGMGLELKPSKTRITHTLQVPDGKPGFDFLGFHVRQYPVGKTRAGWNRWNKRLPFKTLIKPSPAAIERHLQKLRETVDNHRGTDQESLIRALNPLIVGWTNYYSTSVSKAIFRKVGWALFFMLLAWACRRHDKKNRFWVVDKYWRIRPGRTWEFPDGHGFWGGAGDRSGRRRTQVKK